MTTYKPINRWNGLYSVSDDGQVWSHRNNRALRPGTNSRGYVIATVTFDGNRYSASVHVLVAEAFFGPRPDGMHVCHQDNDKSNNTVGNLRYDTQSENENDKLAHGTNANRNKGECPSGHPYDAENTRYARDGRERRCKACARAQAAAYKARKRAERQTPWHLAA